MYRIIEASCVKCVHKLDSCVKIFNNIPPEIVYQHIVNKKFYINIDAEITEGDACSIDMVEVEEIT